MITMTLNIMRGKRVRIAGETFVDKGILVDLVAEANPLTPNRCRFKAWLRTENGERSVMFNDLTDMTLEEEKPAPSTMDKLSTIQKRENLNEVYRTGEPGPGGAYHDYDIYPAGMSVGFKDEFTEIPMACIEFQKGPRKDPNARHGVLDTDLLEIVRDRLKAFQSGPLATEYNAQALIHIEEALMWMNRRVEDRIERQVLGTMEK